MKNALLVAALVAASVAPCPAQKPGPHEAEFRSFHARFLAAVRANDKEKLADLIAFPVDDWSIERKGDVQTGKIKDRADFLARYNSLFTPFMRSHIPRAKLTALDDGAYILVWRDAGSEFSFDFGYIDGTGYRVRSYNIGPV
jgi:hypothetical protein